MPIGPRFCVPALLLLLLTVSSISAQTLTWGVGGAGGSGQWDETTVDWFNGSSNVHWTDGDAAVFAGTAGTVSISGAVTASQVTFNTAGYLLQNYFLDGTGNGLTIQTNQDTTISSSIFGAVSGNTAFTKAGTGLLLVNGGSTPVFFGSITVADGDLRYGNAFLNSSTPFVLGNTAAAALTFVNTTAAVGNLSGGGTTGGVVRPAGTSGSFTLTIYGVADATYAGTLAGNGSATLALQKVGSSTQTLTNTSSALTGTTTVGGGKLVLGGANGALPNTSAVVLNSGGTLQLDNSTNVNAARLGNGVPVTLNGGALSLLGNAGSQGVQQSVGQLYIASGASAVGVTTTGTGATQLVFLKPPLRTPGATASFSDGGQITLTGVSNANGIVGAYATVGADWASVDASGNVSAYTAYSSDTTTASSTDNLRIAPSSATTSLASVTSRNSLDLVNIGNTTATIDLGANGSLLLTSGGLLTSGANGFVIQSGKLAGGNGELVITNQSALTISSLINGAALTKSGAGTLVLTGANTYTGTTTINQGTVQVSADANLGTGTTVALDGGTLQATAGFTSAKSLQGTGGTIDTGSNTVAFTGKTNTGSFSKVGAGILSLTGQIGSVTVNAGTLQLTNLTGTTTSAVTLNGGRLEAGPNGLQYLTTTGFSSPVVSPGPHGQAQELDIATCMVLGPTVVDFDLGSAGSDLLSVSTILTISTGASPAMLFRFNNLGGVQTGTVYTVLRVPSAQLGQFTAGEFGLDPASTAAGYRGTFSIVGGAVDVTFSAVPEPATTVALCLGVVLAWGGWNRLRPRAAREKCGN